MLRAAVAAGTDVGRRAKAIMDRGELVPDAVMVEIIAERVARPDAAKGFILDGFPRTIAQAEALEALLKRLGRRLDAVIQIAVDEDKLVARIEQRARETGGARADDNAETLKTRIAVYRQQTAPVADFYAQKGMLSTVNGMGSVDAVSAAIGNVLKSAEVQGNRPVAS
jgi:adenylate kinase